MNSRAKSPNHHSRPASRKKRSERETIDAPINDNRSKWATPLAIVISLYGIGVMPLMMMIHTPH